MFELIEKFLTPEEVVREFSASAAVVVMPYDNATQSGVAAYAIGVGRAVVAFDVGALHEMVQDGKTGLLCASRATCRP
jgi:glycosyltransferase involved in cell wall biosynthesis